MIYFELFWSFVQIGLFSIGGGYSAIPLIKSQVVEMHQWLTLNQFADIITISEMTPGPIAINSATFVGLQIAGFGGAVIATIGCVFPSCIIVITLARIYFKYHELAGIQAVLGGLRPAIVALVASAGLSILLLALFGSGVFTSIKQINFLSSAIFIVGFIVLRKMKFNPILILVGAGVCGALSYFIFK